MLLSGDLNKIYGEVNRVTEAIMVKVNKLQEEVKELQEASNNLKVKKKVDKAA